MNNVVIIGASHAAVDVIAHLRRNGWTDKITLIGDEQEPPYHRPPLSKAYFNNQLEAERLALRAESFYQENAVDLVLGRTVESLDRAAQQLVLDDGQTMAYSHLVIATGTRARQLPVAGADLPQIHTLRTKSDVDAIKSQLQANSKLLIVGAGYIGLEVAASAVKQGIHVTVLETMERVLARVTGQVVSEFYQELHAQQGVDIRLGASLLEFTGDSSAAQAVLDDATVLDFDCAIVGIGVVPNTELAADAGLPCDNGIVVDEFTRTADPYIYAVGDCSNHPSFIYDRQIRLESVPNAVGQAKTAALAICGKAVAYDQVPWFWSDQYDVKLQTVGLCQGHDQVIVRGEPAEHKFAVFYLQKGRLLAVDALNSPAEFMVAKKLVAAKASPDPQQLADVTISIKDLLS